MTLLPGFIRVGGRGLPPGHRTGIPRLAPLLRAPRHGLRQCRLVVARAPEDQGDRGLGAPREADLALVRLQPRPERVLGRGARRLVGNPSARAEGQALIATGAMALSSRDEWPKRRASSGSANCASRDPELSRSRTCSTKRPSRKFQ